MNNINQLPDTISDDEEGHLDDHEIIHGGLKDHETRITDVEEVKSDVGHRHVINDIDNLSDELETAKSRDASELMGVLTGEVDASSAIVNYPAGDETQITLSFSEFATKTDTQNSSLRDDMENITGSLRNDLTDATDESATIRSDLNSVTDRTDSLENDLSSAVNISTDIRADLQSLTQETSSIASDVESVTAEAGSIRSDMASKANLVAGRIPTSEIPAIALTKPQSVQNRDAMLALEAQEGDVAIITGDNDHKGTYMLGDGPSDVFESWMLLATSAETPVQSVNGQIGTVVLGPLDIGAAKEKHSHTISDISNLQDALDNAGSNDAAELTGALTGQVDVTNAVSDFVIIDNPEYPLAGESVPLSMILGMAMQASGQIDYLAQIINGRLAQLIDLDYGTIVHTHDGADITGALTDQVDVAGSVVTMDVGAGPYPYPTGAILQGVAGLDPRVIALESGKADTDLGNATVAFTHPEYGPLAPALSDWVQGVVDENAALRADLDNKVEVELVTEFPSSPTSGVLYLKAE